MPYHAPLKDIRFVIDHLSRWPEVRTLPAFTDIDDDTINAVFDEMAKLCQNVLALLNHSADKTPSSWQAGKITTSAGFKEAFDQFVSAGWQGLAHPTQYGGQGFPKTLACVCSEMLNSANLSFALCPLLTDGAIEALLVAASDELKDIWVPLLLNGQATGTMNLTEPQAGSDLAAVRSRATVQTDGSYHVSGSKIFITYGDHDLSDNIVHLVLARIDGAPEGIKGLSLFVVPKFVLNADGSRGDRNRVECVSIEHKLGIKASPTAILEFTKATGYIVGQANRGLEYMFTMMNAARFGVGVQGIAVAERATQKAVAYARERVQGKTLSGVKGIIGHPDVTRMLLTMRALTEGARALATVAASYSDWMNHTDQTEVKKAQAIYEFLVPIVKGFATEISIEVASLGVQIHGGMGFIEETGAAQHYRDARILTIYEGTTAIQANDLVNRKTWRDNGTVIRSLCQNIVDIEHSLVSSAFNNNEQQHIAKIIAQQLTNARNALEEVVEFVITNKERPGVVFAGSVNYLMLTGITLAGAQMARAFLVACQKNTEDTMFYEAKINTAWFYATSILPRSRALADSVLQSGPCVTSMNSDWM